MNARHQQFINEYLTCWNGTEAYRRVYPKASYDTARANAATLLANASISEAIQQRITENAMAADEVLTRLAEHARGDIGDFVTIGADGLPYVDFSGENAKMRLVKKVKTKTKTYTPKGEDVPVTEVDVEFELYDAQSALEKLGRHHKLFTDQTDVNLNGILQVVMDR